MRKFTTKKVLESAFVDLPGFCMNMKNKKEVRQELEAISKRAGMMAAYIDERDGYGCGDQGHGKALKNMNKAGKIIWVKVFGYNGHHELSF